MMRMMLRIRRYLGLCALLIFATFFQAFAGGINNPGIVEIRDPSKFTRVVAISDVHGRYGAAKDLLYAYDLIDEEGDWIGGKTLLVVVGDSINKGNKSLKLLDLWIDLAEQSKKVGGRLIHTLGNNEAELLAGIELKPELSDELDHEWISLDELLDGRGKRGRFLKSMPVGARVGDVLFLHAGMPPNLSWREFVTRSRRAMRNRNYDSDLLLGKGSALEAEKWADDEDKVAKVARRLQRMNLSTVVFGHRSEAFGDEEKTQIFGVKVLSDARDEPSKLMVKIDTAMWQGREVSEGRLLFFDNPARMKGKTPPSGIRFSTRSMSSKKPLDPCEMEFESYSAD